MSLLDVSAFVLLETKLIVVLLVIDIMNLLVFAVVTKFNIVERIMDLSLFNGDKLLDIRLDKCILADSRLILAFAVDVVGILDIERSER